MPNRAELKERFPKETRLRELRLTNTFANHNKFYEVWLSKDSRTATYTVLKWWGRIGTGGHMDVEQFMTAEYANKELDKVKRSKLVKGYVVEWDRAGSAAPSAASLKDRIRAVKEVDLPTGTTFDLSEDDEAKSFNKIVTKRKEESSW